MRKLTIRPQARLDLLEIWHHIAANGGIDAANRMGEKLEAAILNLRSWPGMGHARADVKKPGYTFWSVKPYVIVYVYDDKLLRVLRVVHGHRDFRRLFR